MSDVSIGKLFASSPPHFHLIFAVCGGAFVVLFIALIAMSFSILEVDEYGLDYSWISQSVSKTPYNSGWHFLGVGHHFVKFPKVVQTIEFSKTDKEADWSSLTSRTNDGLEVTLEVSFQYMLQAEHIYDLYMNFGENFKTIFIREAIEIITTSVLPRMGLLIFEWGLEAGNQLQRVWVLHEQNNNWNRHADGPHQSPQLLVLRQRRVLPAQIRGSPSRI